MKRNRVPEPLDAASAERLLRGEPVAGHERLATLLAAAAAPARSDELADDTAVVLAFRDGRFAPAPPAPKPTTIRSTLARMFTFKIAMIIAAASGIGGVALAASTGHLPDPARNDPPGGVVVAEEPPASPQPQQRPHASPGQSPIPDRVAWLCGWYTTRDRDHRQKALDSDPELQELVKRAGTRDRAGVDKYCEDVRRAYPSAPPFGNGMPPPNGLPYPSGMPFPSGAPDGYPGFPWLGPPRNGVTPSWPHAWPWDHSAQPNVPVQPTQPSQPPTGWPRATPNG